MDRIDQIISAVETARNVPMSRNCMLDRGEMIGMLEQLRVELPGEMRRECGKRELVFGWRVGHGLRGRTRLAGDN